MTIIEVFNRHKPFFTTDEQKFASSIWQFRRWREDELKDTDWTQLPDSSADKTAWAEYRQALRDLPALTDFPNVEVPVRPIVG